MIDENNLSHNQIEGHRLTQLCYSLYQEVDWALAQRSNLMRNNTVDGSLVSSFGRIRSLCREC